MHGFPCMTLFPHCPTVTSFPGGLSNGSTEVVQFMGNQCKSCYLYVHTLVLIRKGVLLQVLYIFVLIGTSLETGTGELTGYSVSVCVVVATRYHTRHNSQIATGQANTSIHTSPVLLCLHGEWGCFILLPTKGLYLTTNKTCSPQLLSEEKASLGSFNLGGNICALNHCK